MILKNKTLGTSWWIALVAGAAAQFHRLLMALA
jgi:hypothetical protein